jgi:hypothetical protein
MKAEKIIRVALFSILSLAVAGGAGHAAKKPAQTKKAAAKSAKTDQTRTRVLFDFETDLEGWRIPEWAFAKKDNAAREALQANKIASSGKHSLQIVSEFPPKMWSGAYVENEREPGNFFDFTGYSQLLADVFLPSDAPKKLKAQIIISVGDDWSWTEMRKAVDLTPGQWTTIKADISNDSTDWKIRITDAIRSDVRKIGVRVESNYIEYKGNAYVDNVRVDNIRVGSREKK